MALADQLVEFWTLNDTLVGAVAGNPLTASDGATHYVAGMIGNGWDFANTAARNLYQNASPWNPQSGDWSVSMWIKVPAAEFVSNAYLWSVSDGATAKLRSFVSSVALNDAEDGYDLNLHVNFYGTDRTFLCPVMLGNWIHIVWRYDSLANVVEIIANGVAVNPVSSAIGATSTIASPKLSLGAVRLTETPNSPWKSVMDSVGMWSRVVSDLEVAELYDTGTGWEYTPPAPVTVTGVSAALLLSILLSNGQQSEHRIPLGG